MDKFGLPGISRDEWRISNPRVIDYNHKPNTGHFSNYTPPTNPVPSPYLPPSTNLPLPKKVPPPTQPIPHWQLAPTGSMNKQPQSKSEQSSILGTTSTSKPEQTLSCEMRQPAKPTKDTSDFTMKYNPFVEDDMDISDDESTTQSTPKQAIQKPVEKYKTEIAFSLRGNVEVKSGAAFYKGLILYIPPFEQLAKTYRGSPVMKMLYASFDFSFKMPIRVETKPRENNPEIIDTTVFFQDHIVSTGSGGQGRGQVEACVRALELLSETCYTIQAKEEYFEKCKVINGENMRTLNLKKWEAVSQKYPKLLDITKDSHIQKTFAVFLDAHTNTGEYEDIICSNLTRQDVNAIKSVVEFFHLSMMPCSVTRNLSKKTTPCVVSIHKYTSAQKLLDILIESGGENDKFRLYPPDTFKDFYKLHYNSWDPDVTGNINSKDEVKTSLDDEELQALILKPYENTIPELFEKHKSLPKAKSLKEDSQLLRKTGDDFMKETLQIDVDISKNVAPVERMQLLLKYMEQLQEYGSRVLTSGRSEMIKIYHNAIDNLRKDLDSCRKDIEKQQRENTADIIKPHEATRIQKSRSPPFWRKSPSRRRSKSPVRRFHRNSRDRSSSPKRKARSRSPRRMDRLRRSISPRRRPKSKSPRRKSLRIPCRSSPSRNTRSLIDRDSSPQKLVRSPRPSRNAPLLISEEDSIFLSIFKDQFKRYVETVRRFRIEIEDTPIERRCNLKDRLTAYQEQLNNFSKKLSEKPSALKLYCDEIEIFREELKEQTDLIAGKPGPNDLPRNITPPPWINTPSFQRPSVPSYALPGSRSVYGAGPRPVYGANISPVKSLYVPEGGTHYPYSK